MYLGRLPVLTEVRLASAGGHAAAEFDLLGNPPVRGSFALGLRSSTSDQKRHRHVRIDFKEGRLAAFFSYDFERNHRTEHDMARVSRDGNTFRGHFPEAFLIDPGESARVTAFCMLDGRELQSGFRVVRLRDRLLPQPEAHT